MLREPIFPPVKCTSCPKLTAYPHNGMCPDCRLAAVVQQQQWEVRYVAAA